MTTTSAALRRGDAVSPDQADGHDRLSLARPADPLRILFDLGHPAHFHLFRNAGNSLASAGHDITFAIRDKRIIRELVERQGVEAVALSTPRTSLVGLGWELLEHDLKLLRLTQKKRFDLLVGTSTAVAHVSRLTAAKSVVFSEDDARVVRLFANITYPFADRVVVPSVITDRRRSNYVCHESYHELAYLHPNHFRPDPTVISELGLSPGEQYSIVRLVAFKAHHDVGEKGLAPNTQQRLVDLLSRYGRVFITAEGDLPARFQKYRMAIPPNRMHDAMAFARILVTDSQTMTAEAAVLGTPAIRCNTFVGRLAYLDELESRYGLAYGYLPSQTDEMLETIRTLLECKDLGDEWRKRRERMLMEKADMHEWMVRFLLSLGERSRS